MTSRPEQLEGQLVVGRMAVRVLQTDIEKLPMLVVKVITEDPTFSDHPFQIRCLTAEGVFQQWHLSTSQFSSLLTKSVVKFQGNDGYLRLL